MLFGQSMKMFPQYLLILALFHNVLLSDANDDLNQPLALGNSTTGTVDDDRGFLDSTLPFEKTTVQSEETSTKCSEYGTCEFASTLPTGLRYCYCDSVCALFKDCCSNANTEQMVNSRNTDQAFPTCTQPIFPRNKHFGTFVVNSCPVSFSDIKIKDKCSSRIIADVGPWVASKANVVYQNKFCAQCNSVFSYIPFNINITSIGVRTIDGSGIDIHNSSTFNLIKELTTLAGPPFTTMVPPPGIELRDCFMYDQDLKCDSNFSHPVHLKRYLFELPNGDIVHERYISNAFCQTTDEYDDICYGNSLGGQQAQDMFPLSALFQYTDTNDLYCHREGSEFCLEDPVFVNYEIYTFHSFEISNQIMVSNPFLHQLGVVLHTILSSGQVSARSSNVVFYSLPKSNNSCFLEFEFVGTVQMKGNSGLMQDSEEALKNIVWHLKFTTPLGNVFEIGNNQSIITYIDQYIQTDDTSRPVVLDRIDQPYFYRDRLSSSELPSYISIPRNNNELCNEYLIESDLSTEQFDSEFIVAAIKCPGLKEPNTDIAKTILTYVGLFSSVIMLIISVVFFRKAKMHRSVPGSNVENLCVSLILANILFMVGIGANDYYWVCYCIGVALHYLLLVVFYFKTASLVYICFRMRHILMNINIQREMSSASKNTIVGYVFPLCFVTVAVLVDRFGIFGLDLSYSGTVCFPTGFPGSIFFVSVPIGLSVVINILCMTIIVGILGRVSLDIQLVRRSSSYQFIFVLGRIAVVTGLFWIFGIVESVVRHTVTEYIFIIFCSFQGCLIAVANLSTKRVYKLMK